MKLLGKGSAMNFEDFFIVLGLGLNSTEIFGSLYTTQNDE
jgi:hypothetical protein